MEGDPAETQRAHVYRKFHPPLIPNEEDVLEMVSDCDVYRAALAYPEFPASSEEAAFPIAYTIVVHQGAWQIQKLLRAIYEPQNFYCIHVDLKADERFFRAMSGLAACFPNVFLASKRETVVWASYARLQADLTCMKDLLWKNSSWRYVINLTGQEFPLKTNLEMVKILQIYNGANDIEGKSRFTTYGLKKRFMEHWELARDKHGHLSMAPAKGIVKEPPPFGIVPIKGSAFGTFSRQFVEFVFSSD